MEITSCLQGAQFPSGKDELIAHAQMNCGKNELKAIRRIPEKTYSSADDVTMEMK